MGIFAGAARPPPGGTVIGGRTTSAGVAPAPGGDGFGISGAAPDFGAAWGKLAQLRERSEESVAEWSQLGSAGAAMKTNGDSVTVASSGQDRASVRRTAT